jgi:hypothetical protein
VTIWVLDKFEEQIVNFEIKGENKQFLLTPLKINGQIQTPSKHFRNSLNNYFPKENKKSYRKKN